MSYLIIDKRQRLTDKTPTASKRLVEEVKKRKMDCDFIYNDQLEFLFHEGEIRIKANKKDITGYKYIIFRGHALHNDKEYHFKRYIVDYIDEYNLQNPGNKILVQNSEAIKNFPYYNKIAMALLCSQKNIPYFNTYYKTDGDYLQDRDMLKNFPLILKEYSGVNRIEKIDNKEKIKKNVFKIEKEEDIANIEIEDLSDFFLQEFSEAGEDYRIFVKLGKVIGGWKRKATDGFMTVRKGEYEMYNQPNEEISKIAERFASTLQADFIAVDFMYIHNKPYVQEISLHPGFKAYETKIEGTPVNIAEAIITAFKE